MSLLGGILGEVLKGALGGNVNPQQQSHLPDIFGQILKGTDLPNMAMWDWIEDVLKPGT